MGFLESLFFFSYIKILVERKFVCKNCGMGFKRSDYLTEHLNKKTKCIKKGSTPFVCTICERTFTEKRYLTEHMKRRTCIKKQMWYKGPMNWKEIKKYLFGVKPIRTLGSSYTWQFVVQRGQWNLGEMAEDPDSAWDFRYNQI